MFQLRLPGCHRFLIGATILSTLVDAVAHPTRGYGDASVKDGEVEFRITLALSAWNELVTLDGDHNGKVTRTEIAAALPDLRDGVLETVRMEFGDAKLPFGRVTSVDCLWPDDVDAGEGTFGMEGCYLDLTFSCPAPPAEIVRVNFEALLERMKSLERIDVSMPAAAMQIAQRGESLVVLKFFPGTERSGATPIPDGNAPKPNFWSFHLPLLILIAVGCFASQSLRSWLVSRYRSDVPCGPVFRRKFFR